MKFILLGLGLFAAQGALAQYQAVDITPPSAGSVFGDPWAEGNGAATGMQVGAGVSAGDSISPFRQAAMWMNTVESMILLMPGVYSEAYGTDGIQQVGFVGDPANAALWSGSAASYVNLNPPGFAASVAYGCSNSEQAGWGLTPFTSTGEDSRFRLIQGGSHAIKWSGTAASFVDLNPVGFDASTAAGVENGVEVGSGVNDNGQTRPLRWTGTSQSYVDLTPPLIDFPGGASQAFGIHGGQTVGYYTSYGAQHAAIWNGADGLNVVDLHPAGYYHSMARATNGKTQVGWASVGTGLNFESDIQSHAMVWNGTANSAIDLHQFLPAGWINSYATAIGEDGTITVTTYDFQPGSQAPTSQLSWYAGTHLTHTYLLTPCAPSACAVSSVTFDQSSIYLTNVVGVGTLFSQPVNGTVTLTAPAPPGGATVRLLNMYLTTLESSVTVPEGQTSATFLATDPKLVYTWDATLAQNIMASYGGVTKQGHYVTISQFPEFPGPVRQGTLGMVRLALPVDADEMVTLGSDNPSVLQVPLHVLLKKGMALAEYSFTETPALTATNVAVIGTCSRGTFSAAFTIPGHSEPIAAMGSISPSTVISGTPFTMTITGNTFAMGAQVMVGSVAVPTHVLSPTLITADIPASATPIAAPTPVSVVNPKAFASPALLLASVGPTFTSITPNSVIAGASTNVTLKGTNFVPGTQLAVAGAPTVLNMNFVSSTQVTGTIPGNFIPVAGSVQVWVKNPNSFADTAALTISISNPKPVIGALSPSAVPVGSPDTVVAVLGTGFVSSCQAFVNGKLANSRFVSPTEVDVTVPAASLAKSTKLTLTVSNPSPGGGGSNGFNLVIG